MKLSPAAMLLGSAIFMLAMFAGCRPDDAPPDSRPDQRVQRSPIRPLPANTSDRDELLVIPAQWNYTTRDEAGHDLARGSFTMPLSLQQGVSFVGSWQARYVGPIEQQPTVGPQIGGGRLGGEFNNDGQIVINLNPNMNDNNVRLLGRIDREGHMTGAWSYSNFTGLANHGSFEATLQK